MALDTIKSFMKIRHPLTVFESPYEKRRIGRDNDGGYVVCTGEPMKCSALISAGVNDDISFEEAFLKEHNVPCFAFDGTVDKFPDSSYPIQFFKQNIDVNQNLHHLINKFDSVFIKMDIEGAEFEWIQSLSKEHLDKINQIVIEFHFPFDGHKWACIDKLASTHWLVHLHPNNCCGTRQYDGYTVPCVFECTFISKKFASQLELNKKPIPDIIDQANAIDIEDIKLSGTPYVSDHY